MKLRPVSFARKFINEKELCRALDCIGTLNAEPFQGFPARSIIFCGIDTSESDAIRFCFCKAKQTELTFIDGTRLEIYRTTSWREMFDVVVGEDGFQIASAKTP